MTRPLLKCVKCGATLKRARVMPAGPFSCATCGTRLQVAATYTQFIGWVSLLVPIFFFAALGLRGLHLVGAVLVAFVPVLYVGANFLKYALSPKIEIYLPEDSSLNLRDGPHS
jgi:predicted RNA-binding Zn-ribbon protein involved in translation (DUF1610 family)